MHPDKIDSPIGYTCKFANVLIKRLLREQENMRKSNQRIKSSEPQGVYSNELLSQEEYNACLESVKKLIEKLPKSSYKILQKFILEEKTIEEIRKELHYKTKNVMYTKICRSRALLRKKIESSPNHKMLKEIVILLGYEYRK